MAGVDRISRAELQVREARDRFERTLGTLQLRLNPRRIARDAWADAREKGAELAETAVETARRRPVLVGLAAAAITAFLARGRLVAAVRGLTGRSSRRRGRPEETTR